MSSTAAASREKLDAQDGPRNPSNKKYLERRPNVGRTSAAARRASQRIGTKRADSPGTICRAAAQLRDFSPPRTEESMRSTLPNPCGRIEAAPSYSLIPWYEPPRAVFPPPFRLFPRWTSAPRINSGWRTRPAT